MRIKKSNKLRNMLINYQALQTDIKNTMVISNKTTIFILRTKRDKEINGFILHCEECNQSKAEQELHIRVYPTGHRYK